MAFLAFGWWKLMICLYIPQNVPNSHEDIGSHTHVGNKWLLKGQDNLQLGPGPATFQPPHNQSSNRPMAKQMHLLSRSFHP